MRRLSLSSVLAAALFVRLVAASSAQAQSIPVEQAQGFMGAWTLAIDAQGQALEMGVNITNEDGNVAAEVSADSVTSKVTQISKDADKLVLAFSIDALGEAIAIVVKLALTEAGLDAEMDVAAGMFTTTGKGTRKP